MYGYDILCGISKAPFEIPHKISYPYIERYEFYTTLKFYKLLDLRAHMRFWNARRLQIVIDIRAWISICIHWTLRSSISHSCIKFNE